MNRNTVYRLFSKLLHTYKVKVNGKPYTKMYFGREDEISYVFINNQIYIEDINEVYICTDELVLRGNYGDMKINIKYHLIKELRIGKGNDDEIIEVTQAKDEEGDIDGEIQYS